MTNALNGILGEFRDELFGDAEGQEGGPPGDAVPVPQDLLEGNLATSEATVGRMAGPDRPTGPILTAVPFRVPYPGPSEWARRDLRARLGGQQQSSRGFRLARLGGNRQPEGESPRKAIRGAEFRATAVGAEAREEEEVAGPVRQWGSRSSSRTARRGAYLSWTARIPISTETESPRSFETYGKDR